MKILVTGAKGMLGQDLCPILEDEDFDVIESGHEFLDVTDKENIEEVFEKYKPDFVIHTAAYTNVDEAEDNKELAFKINGEGTENIAKICKKSDIPILYVSTDYVFDGTKKGKYLPKDETNPINIYGASKLAITEYVNGQCKYFRRINVSYLRQAYNSNINYNFALLYCILYEGMGLDEFTFLVPNAEISSSLNNYVIMSCGNYMFTFKDKIHVKN